MTTHPLIEWLKAKKISQVELAAKAGVSAPYLSQIISRQRRPSPEIALRIEKMTGVDARELLGIPRGAR